MKKYICVLSITLALLSCAACEFGRGDWKYPLPNRYQVFMSNSKTAAIVGEEYYEANGIMTKTYIDSYVASFCYDERYVAARQQTPKEAPAENELPVTISYFLLDTLTASVYGPYNLSEYETKLLEFGDLDLGEWISTSAAPNNAVVSSNTVS